jgi:hypothetical protein
MLCMLAVYLHLYAEFVYLVCTVTTIYCVKKMIIQILIQVYMCLG